MVDKREIWIKTGYETFANFGADSLKIEPLTKKVGKSKYSFYQHFVDLEMFIESLMVYHIDMSRIIAVKEQNTKNIDPELIDILIEHKTDLLFNRELRIHENIKLFADTLCKSNEILGDAFKFAWLKNINLDLNQKQIEGVFSLALQNFYLQINSKNLNYERLSSYFRSLKEISDKFIVQG